MRSLTLLLLVFPSMFGCAARPTSPRPVASAAPPARGDAERHVYRLDFVLTASDGGGPTSTTSFTLNLPENDKGEMRIGKNVALSTLNPSAGGSTMPLASPRQDVGMKVDASLRPFGANVLIDVSTEMSAVDAPSSIRKMVSRGSALALAGKPALVSTLEDDHRRYQLTVTATRLQ